MVVGSSLLVFETRVVSVVCSVVAVDGAMKSLVVVILVVGVIIGGVSSVDVDAIIVVVGVEIIVDTVESVVCIDCIVNKVVTMVVGGSLVFACSASVLVASVVDAVISDVVGSVAVVGCFVNSVIIAGFMFGIVVGVTSENGNVEESVIIDCSSGAVAEDGVLVVAVDAVVDSVLLVTGSNIVIVLSFVCADCVVISIVVIPPVNSVLVGDTGVCVVNGVFSVKVGTSFMVVEVILFINVVDSVVIVVGSVDIIACVVDSVVVLTSFKDMIVGVVCVAVDASGLVLVTRVIADAVDSPVGGSVGVIIGIVNSVAVVNSTV